MTNRDVEAEVAIKFSTCVIVAGRLALVSAGALAEHTPVLLEDTLRRLSKST